MIESRFMKYFNALRENKASFTLRANNILVEIIEEKIEEGGIEIVSDMNQIRGGARENQGFVGLVLAVGEGYTADDGSMEPLDLKVGNVVLLPKYSVSMYTVFPGLPGMTRNDIGICVDQDIKFYYDSIEEYVRVKEITSAVN